MKHLHSLLITSVLIVSPTLSHGAADLVVHPTRIVFDKNTHSAQIDITNTGNEIGTYRIVLENKRMDENGKFVPATTPAAGELFATDLLQFSPRQTELAPGAGQTVRVLLRKPADLAPGEYRSHLLFSPVAGGKVNSVETNSANKPEGNEIGITLTPLIGVSIPIIVRQGETQAQASLSELKYTPVTKNDPAILEFKIGRTGNQSLYGDITVNHISPSGSVQKIAAASGIAIYTPNTTRLVRIALRPKSPALLANGQLQVVFQEQSDNSAKPLADGSLKLE